MTQMSRARCLQQCNLYCQLGAPCGPGRCDSWQHVTEIKRRMVSKCVAFAAA